MSIRPICPPIALGLFFCLSTVNWEPFFAQAAELTPSPANVQRSVIALSGETAQVDRLFDRARQEAEKLTDQEQKILTLATIAKYLRQAGRPEAANQLFDRAIALANTSTPEFTLYQQQDALEQLAVQLAQAGLVDRALSLAQTIPGEFPKAKALQRIAEILVEQGDRKRARDVLWDALRFARGISRDYAYEANGSCANYKFEVLSKIAGTLSWLDQVDTALTVAQGIHGCSSANGDSGQEYQAWAFLGILAHVQRVEAVQQIWTTAQPVKDTVEQPQIWAAIAIKWVELNQPEMALAVAEKLAAESPSTFMGYAREIGAKEQAQQAIAQALAEKKHFQAAIQVAQAIAEPPPAEVMKLQQQGYWAYPLKHRSTTLTNIAHQLARAQQFDQALQVADTIPNATLKKLAWIAIAADLQQAGQVNQAERLVAQASQTILPQPDDAEGNAAMETIALALVKSGQIKLGLETANTIPYRLYRESALREIAVMLANQGDLETAQTLLESLEGEGSQAIVTQQIVEKQLALGQFQTALGGLSSLDDTTQATLLIRYAAPLSSGHLDRALALIETLPNSIYQVEAIAAFAAALAQASQ